MNGTRTPTDPAALWEAIRRAGGIDTWIHQRLVDTGFATERRPTDDMSKAELKRYKAQLKAEAAERRSLRKASWEAYRATHIVHLGDAYWNDADDYDPFDLEEPEIRAAENELPKLASPKDLAELLELTVPELRWLTYHREAATSLHYARFVIPKKSGGERPIWAPLPKLKAAQRTVLREIVEHLPVHGAAHGFLAGRSIVSNARAHTDSRALLTVDLQDFFPTVTWRRVKGVFRKAGYRSQVSTLLALLCTEAPRRVVERDGKTWYLALGPRCLPQGAPTSPALTNTLCLRLDRRLSGLARHHGWRYTRYADDLTFSLPDSRKGPPHLGALLGGIKAITADEGFALNPDKTRVARKGARQAVTGLLVNGGAEPRTPRALRRTLRAAIHNLEAGKPPPEGESLARLAGYAAFVYQTDPALGGRMLDALGRIAGPG